MCETGVETPFVVGFGPISLGDIYETMERPSMNTKLLQRAVFFLASGLCIACWVCVGLAAEADPPRTEPEEQPYDPEAFRQTLDPFYKQHIVADGLVVAGSEKVSIQALREVGYLARKMLANRPDVMKDLCEKRKMFVAVMAYCELQPDLPDCRGMSLWWAYRARGLGSRPVSCGEENVLGLEGDPWEGENIFIHEFAHGMQGMIAGLDEQFDTRLRALYDEAKQSGRFRGYAIDGGVGEFWAEGVQAWFDCNGTIRPKSGGGQSSFEVVGPQGEHVCHLQTREQMKTHVPKFAKLLDDSFRQNKWVYVPVANRRNEPHLSGFDWADAPKFRWPAAVVEAFERIEAENAKAREAKRAKQAEEAKKREQ